MTTLLDVAWESSTRLGIPLVPDPTMAPGIMWVYQSVLGHADAIHLHPDADRYDIRQNSTVGWSNDKRQAA